MIGKGDLWPRKWMNVQTTSGGGEQNVLLGACLDVDLLDQTRVGHHLK